MPKPSTTETALARVREIRLAPEQFDLRRDLASFFQHKSNHVIAAAANVARQQEAALLAPELTVAALALFPNAPQRDLGCKALIAIAEALVSMGESAPEVYLKGVRYVQKEGSFGPPVDVAAPLRGLCARGLVRMRHPEGLYEAVSLLADPEIAARVGAVGALEDANSREAELLLRLKVLTGGPGESEVMGSCFSALLEIAPVRSCGFVAGYLRARDDELVEAAALALGEARLAAALDPLRDAWAANRRPFVRRTILLGIAMLRQDDGVEFLILRLKQDPEGAVMDVLEALALYRSDPAIRVRVREIAERRNLPNLSQAASREWQD